MRTFYHDKALNVYGIRMYTGSSVPPPPRAVPLPRHTGEASGSNGIIASPAYGGSGEPSEPKGACPPPSLIRISSFYIQRKMAYNMSLRNGKRGGTMLPGIGIIANVAAIALGGLLGLGCGRFIAERVQETLMRACALAVMFLGLGGTLRTMLSANADGQLALGGVYMMITSLIVGGLIGELLNIEARMTAFGAWLKRVSGSAGDTRFIEGFVTASLTVCIGAMAVIGSINDRLLGDPSVLFTKSVLDGVIIMLLTATLGKGCIFSSISVGLFQGAIFALAGLLAPYMTDSALAGLSCVGNILIFAIGTNLLGLPNIRVANFLPALVIAALWGMG